MLQKSVLVLVSTFLAIGAAEIVLRTWLPESDDTLMYQFDAVLGWVNRKNARSEFVRGEFHYWIETNSYGMRDLEIEAKRRNEFRVAFLGDSLTWGWGVGYGDRFTEIVEERNGEINALNFGVPGYGPVQYLLQLDADLAMQPDYVVVVFCLGNDLTDVLVADNDYPKPYASVSSDLKLSIIGYPLPAPTKRGDGKWATTRVVDLFGQAYNRLVDDPDNERVPYELFYAPRESLQEEQRKSAEIAYDIVEALLDTMRKRTTAAIGPDRFSVLLAPTKYEQGKFLERWPGANAAAVAEKMIEIMARLKIPVLDGREAIGRDDFWRLDGHWRPSGHRKVGEMLVEFLSKKIEEVRGVKRNE
jgi:lysophospholipase L1-like esterase